MFQHPCMIVREEERLRYLRISVRSVEHDEGTRTSPSSSQSISSPSSPVSPSPSIFPFSSPLPFPSSSPSHPRRPSSPVLYPHLLHPAAPTHRFSFALSSRSLPSPRCACAGRSLWPSSSQGSASHRLNPFILSSLISPRSILSFLCSNFRHIVFIPGTMYSVFSSFHFNWRVL